MLNVLKRILSPPQFENNPEKTHQALLVHYTSLIMIVVPVFLLYLNTRNAGAVDRSVNAVLAGIALVQLFVQWLMRRGIVCPLMMFLLLVSWAGLTWIASRMEGAGDVAVLGYFILLLLAGYALGWRTVTLLTSWTLLAIWALAIFEALGWLHPIRREPIHTAIVLTIFIVVASFEIYFVINALRRLLKNAMAELQERQRVETILREEREKLHLALNASKMETWEWNIATGTVIWSEGIEAMFGLEKGQFDGKYQTYLSMIHPDDRADVQHAIQQALSAETYDYVIEHRILLPDDSVRWLEGRGKVYRNEDGRPVRMVGTVVDVTSRKNAEAERERLIQDLAAKNLELEQFTYTVSHDLKAPIITLKGFLGFLNEDARSGNVKRLEKDILRINEAADKMHRLLHELLELSRIGRLMNPPQPVPFRDLIDEAVEVLQGRLESTRAMLKITDPLPTVYGDRRRLLEVVQNLLDNAAKFSAVRPQPIIEIGCEDCEKEMPVLYIRDNGIGISPEHHERIFGLFNKLDPIMEGTGIGLALVRRIVEFHGGRIWVQSEAGSGATIYFTLPAANLKPDSV
ncbi:MAG: PAS domain-containing protein [Chloroflexi bacterium]|nr:PAS domain-containing protein [Chloroflexota bacterium]